MSENQADTVAQRFPDPATIGTALQAGAAVFSILKTGYELWGDDNRSFTAMLINATGDQVITMLGYEADDVKVVDCPNLILPANAGAISYTSTGGHSLTFSILVGSREYIVYLREKSKKIGKQVLSGGSESSDEWNDDGNIAELTDSHYNIRITSGNAYKGCAYNILVTDVAS